MKKLFFLVYGIIAYLIFFGTFLYAIGFVSSVFVPKHIDSPPESSLGFTFLVNAGLLTLFALQHSIMARPAFKKWWTRLVPEPVERSTYVLLASLCLLLLFRYWQPMGIIIWEVKPGAFEIILKTLCFIGFGMVLISTLLIDHFDLFGLRQVVFNFLGEKYEPISFRTPYFYKYVRHPLYFGFMIAFWSAPTMTAAHLFFAVATTIYMLVAIQFEENDLTKTFGERYQNYKTTTPMLIPFSKTPKNRK